MKSIQRIVTSGNSPLTIPLSPRGGPVGIGATPAGAGNYTIEFTLTPLNEGLTINPHEISTIISTAVVQQAQIGPVTALIVTLNSGTSVTVDLTQSDV